MEIGNSHLIAALASTPWCLQSTMFSTFETVLNNKYTLGLNVTELKAAQAQAQGSNLGSIRKSDSRKGVIFMEGTLLKRAYLANPMSSPKTLDDIQNELRVAANDPEVDTIVLAIDSPGGQLPGTAETAELISKIGQSKPVIGYGNGNICSAAYWIASACTELYASHTTCIGSIGVYMAHISQAKELEAKGLKVTVIKAGKYKAIGNSASDLSKEDIEFMQSKINNTYELFMGDVAKYRGVDLEIVRNEWADARLFTGQEAVKAGLIDGICSFDDILTNDWTD